MKREDNIKLGVISSIDESFIDEATESRILYSSKSAKSKSFFRSPKFMATAASIVLLISSLIAIFSTVFSDSRQVPIYRGMTVSSEAPVQDDSTASLLSAIISPSKGFASAIRDNIDIEDEVDEFLDINSEKDIYYAKPGEDAYITVHIDNPDNFEILSFTLNGIKYTSYMFEDGSDMENLVLKVNVGEEPGLKSYTIDAIKYVDGEKIKDVKMLGDKTVNIGIYNPNQPTAKITDTSLSFSEFSFTATVTDPAGLVAATNGRICAILFKGTNVIKAIEFSGKETCSIKFDSLEPGSYSYAIVAIFDAYDGAGFSSHILKRGTFSNKIQLDVEQTEIWNYPPNKTVHFNITSYNDLVTVEKAEIIRESDSAVLASITDISQKAFVLEDNTACGTCYIQLTCSYIGEGGTKSCSFKSEAFVIPMLPVVGEISRPYDDSVSHKAVDFTPTTDNMNVYSCTDGTVMEIYTSEEASDFVGFAGTTVIISGPSGIYYKYSLLEGTNLEKYDTVKMGDIIGTVGSFDFGNECEDEPHLHLEMYHSGNGNKSVIPPFVPSQELVVKHELYNHNTLIKETELNARGTSTDITYSSQGLKFSDVRFEYSSTSEYVQINGSKITYNFDEMPQGSTEIEITITAKLGDIEETYVHTITVNKQ
jgi:murein DD-endopeptidase MepM/ murein hydrolase activator NlpD